MYHALPILNDSIFVVFNLLIFMQVITLKKDRKYMRPIMHAGCVSITIVYFLAVYFLQLPPSVAALFFISIPSLLLFSYVSEYKGSRFLQTFCAVNTVTYAAAYIPRWFNIGLSPKGQLITFIVAFVGFYLIYRGAIPYFKRYRDFMKLEEDGWGTMAAASAVIYVVLVITASYPKPLAERPEFAFSYLMLCIAILSSYYIFVLCMIKSGVIYRQNLKLMQAQKIYQIAYTDSLTGVFSRASYDEHMEQLQREGGTCRIAIIIFDMNHFKDINDHFGHQEGDKVLKYAAEIIQTIFAEECYTVYRLGGDEFIILDSQADRQDIERKISLVQWHMEKCKKFSFNMAAAAGYAIREAGSDESPESVFSRADREMYSHKTDGRL